jgi:hypothetical protein
VMLAFTNRPNRHHSPTLRLSPPPSPLRHSPPHWHPLAGTPLLAALADLAETVLAQTPTVD